MLAMAALLHDVGKVGQRANADSPSEVNKELFCKKDPERRFHTHLHAAWTAEFIERYLQPLWEGRGSDQVLRWAAAHHVSSGPLEAVVAEADRLSSGMDRPQNEDRPDHNPAVVALEPVLGRVSRPDASANQRATFLPARPLELQREALFPLPDRPRSLDYPTLWTGLCRDTEALAKGFDARLLEDLDVTLAALAFVLERYTWCVPASTISTPRDVSLWDHARSAAAIAACIAFDERAETDETYVYDRNDQRYALVCADIAGIQNYLHALKSEGARRSLTGRSFYVQLLQDAVARRLCARFDLPLSCALYQGGGKVWLLVPACLVEEIRGLSEEVDLDLWTETGGLLGFGVGVALLSGNDLVDRKVGSKWRKAMQDLQAARLKRMAGIATHSYDGLFAPSGFKRYPCEQCDRETDDAQRVCDHCRMTAQVGQRLGKIVAVVPARLPRGLPVTVPKSLNVSYTLVEGIEELDGCAPLGMSLRLPQEEQWRECAKKGVVLSFWPVATSPSEEFLNLAARNPGAPRLAVLRADVDGLGDLFEKGLPREEQSLSRMAALSRAISVFFGGYVRATVQARWSETVRIVFSGGDDVFFVGSFFAMPQVARWLRNEWQAFGGGNPALSLSAGLAVQGPKDPLIATARRALAAVHAAKNVVRNGRKKDAVSLLGHDLSWKELERAGALAARLATAVGDLSATDAALDDFLWPELPEAQGGLPRSVLPGLRDICSCYWMGRGGDDGNLERIVNSHRWRWVAAYAIRRAAEGARGQMNRHFLTSLSQQLLHESAAPGERPLIEWLQPAVEWAFLLTRPQG